MDPGTEEEVVLNAAREGLAEVFGLDSVGLVTVVSVGGLNFDDDGSYTDDSQLLRRSLVERGWYVSSPVESRASAGEEKTKEEDVDEEEERSTPRPNLRSGYRFFSEGGEDVSESSGPRRAPREMQGRRRQQGLQKKQRQPHQSGLFFEDAHDYRQRRQSVLLKFGNMIGIYLARYRFKSSHGGVQVSRGLRELQTEGGDTVNMNFEVLLPVDEDGPSASARIAAVFNGYPDGGVDVLAEAMGVPPSNVR